MRKRTTLSVLQSQLLTFWGMSDPFRVVFARGRYVLRGSKRKQRDGGLRSFNKIYRDIVWRWGCIRKGGKICRCVVIECVIRAVFAFHTVIKILKYCKEWLSY